MIIIVDIIMMIYDSSGYCNGDDIWFYCNDDDMMIYDDIWC